jgi:broad specificity phosphatase PhoE
LTATDRPDARRTDRYEAPAYLARYQQRRGAGPSGTRHSGTPPAGNGAGSDGGSADNAVPLYLRRFRERTGAAGEFGAAEAGPATGDVAMPDVALAEPTRSGLVSPDLVSPDLVSYEGQVSPDLVSYEGQTFTPALAEVTRGKEIAAPLERRAAEQIVADISIIRHGITQGYSADAGLTPMGAWQAHRRGHELARRVNDGEQVRIVCADTARARQTAGQLYRGMTDGLVLFGITAEVTRPEPIPELRNFGVWTPDGVRDVTSAFRLYHAAMERFERMAVGDRPRWMVEIDRFYRIQFGGADPIQAWLQVPMMYFEPPQACVRRFWRGISRLVSESPGQRILAATHSGPMRAFATWAHGYDPGEPLNTEEIRVKIRKGGATALVSYRNRVTEVHIPLADEAPDWEAI